MDVSLGCDACVDPTSLFRIQALPGAQARASRSLISSCQKFKAKQGSVRGKRNHTRKNKRKTKKKGSRRSRIELNVASSSPPIPHPCSLCLLLIPSPSRLKRRDSRYRKNKKRRRIKYRNISENTARLRILVDVSSAPGRGNKLLVILLLLHVLTYVPSGSHQPFGPPRPFPSSTIIARESPQKVAQSLSFDSSQLILVAVGLVWPEAGTTKTRGGERGVTLVDVRPRGMFWPAALGDQLNRIITNVRIEWST